MGQLILPIGQQADIENQSRILESIIGGNVAAFVTESRLFELIGILAYVAILGMLVANTSRQAVQEVAKPYRYIGLLVSVGLLCFSIYLASVLRQAIGGNIVAAVTDTLLGQAPRHHNFLSAFFAKIGQTRLELPYHTTMANTANILFYVTLPISVGVMWLTRTQMAKLVQGIYCAIKNAVHAVHRRV